MQWGWNDHNFTGVYLRLLDNVDCFANFSQEHPEMATVLENPPTTSEEKRASQLFFVSSSSSCSHSCSTRLTTRRDATSTSRLLP